MTQFVLWITSSTPTACEVLATQSGIDVILIDGQHGAFGPDECISLVTAASRGSQTKCAVRVSSANSDAEICRCIDAGASIVVCPMVNSKQTCEQFVENCFYPPKGSRSYGPYRHKMVNHNDFSVSNANKQVIALAMIETKTAVMNLSEILSVKHLGGIFIGPNDLSLSLVGNRTSSTPTDEVLAVIMQILKETLNAGKIAGIFCADVKTAKHMAELGFNFVVFGSDVNLVLNTSRTQFESLSRM